MAYDLLPSQRFVTSWRTSASEPKVCNLLAYDLLPNQRFVTSWRTNIYIVNPLAKEIRIYDGQQRWLSTIPTPDANFSVIDMKYDTFENKVFLIWDKELYTIDKKKDSLQRHPLSDYTQNIHNIHDLAIDKAGNIWICGPDRTLFYYDNQREKVYDFSEALHQLIPRILDLPKIVVDRTGVLWLQTVLGGIRVVPQDALF